MSVASKTESIAEKKARLGQRLLELKDKWPVAERGQWSIDNGCNSESIKNSYMRGRVPKIPVAESLIAAMEKYCLENGIAA